MTLGKGQTQLGPQKSHQLWIWCEGTQLLLLLQTPKILLQASKPFLSQDDRHACSWYFIKILLAVLITPKQVSFILGLMADISSWISTPQQQHLEKLKCNTFGELDRSVTPLHTPFKTILLSHKEANGSQKQRQSSRKEIKFTSKYSGRYWIVRSYLSTMSTIDHSSICKSICKRYGQSQQS